MVERCGPNREGEAGFARYPQYRDSGVEWLKEIPAHWEVKRTKFAATLRSGHTPSRQKPEYWKRCTIPWFGLADIWQIREGQVEYVQATAERISEIGLANSAARLLPEGTVILSRTASVGFSAILGVDMATTQDFVNWICGPSLRPEYLLYAFRAMEPEFRRLTMGSTHQTIYMHDVASFSTPVPPIPEQDQIVTFVRRETARIDALVAKEQELIGLLQEKRSTLISHAVTKGLDPDPAMEDSGVEWLGEIPAHWEVVQLRRVAFDRCDGPFGSGLKSTHYAEDGVRVVRLQNIGHGEFEEADAAFIPQEHYLKLGDHSVLPGDLLIAGLGDANHPAGRACVAPANIGSAMVKADCFRFRLDHSRAQPQFLALQLSATASIASGLMSTGATRQRTSLASTAARAIAIPDLQEQSRIVDYVTRKTVRLDHAQQAVQRGIDHLKEYRTALISAAVTGKIDVRRAPQTDMAPNLAGPENTP